MKIELGEAGVEKQTHPQNKSTGPEHRGISFLLGLKSRRRR